MRNLLIDRPSGGHVRLGEVADVRIADTPAVIERDAVSRFVDVDVDVDPGASGRSIDSVASDIEVRLAEMGFPLEYHAEVRQDATSQEVGAGRVLGFAVVVALAAFLLLQAAFRAGDWPPWSSRPCHWPSPAALWLARWRVLSSRSAR